MENTMRICKENQQEEKDFAIFVFKNNIKGIKNVKLNKKNQLYATERKASKNE